jgi:hypothetical protein
VGKRNDAWTTQEHGHVKKARLHVVAVIGFGSNRIHLMLQPSQFAVRTVFRSAVCHEASGEKIMTFRPDMRMDKAAFLAWIETKEAYYELAGGRVVALPRPTPAHALIKTNLLVTARKRRLDRLRWVVLPTFGIDVGPDTFRYPDVVVDRAGGNGKNFAATAPALLAEVLSPESVPVDLGDKAAEYLEMPSLLCLHRAVAG